MKVVVCTPLRNAMTHYRFTTSMVSTMNHIRNVELSWVTCVGNSILPDARACVVADALGHGADKIVFIDDDMSWTPVDFRFLITHPVEAVTGLYVIRNFDDNVPCTSAVRFFNDENRDTGEDGLVQVEGSGFGFICFDRSVFERLAPHTQKLKPGPTMREESKPFYREWFPFSLLEVENGEYIRVGEDMGFARLMKQHGIPLWLDPAIQLGHHEGGREYRPNLDLYGAMTMDLQGKNAA